MTLSGSLSGAGSLTLNDSVGTGTLILTASNTYTGTTTIGSGTLQIGNGGSGASIGGTSGVTDNASLIFDHSDTVTFNPLITGSGSLTQTGSGVLILTNSNSYSGATTISSGSLQIGNGGSGASIGGAPGVTDNGSLVFNHGDAVIFNQVVTGKGSLTQTGSGILILTNSNSYTGTTTIGGGTLQIGAGGASGSVAGNIADNGVVVFSRSDSVTFGKVISGSGSLIQAGPGMLLLSANDTCTGGATISAGTLQLGDGVVNNGAVQGNVADSGVLAFANPLSQTYSGQISGSGSVIKTGAGTMVLIGSNSYSGGTLINGGTLQIGNGGIGASIGGTSGVTDNASLVFNHRDAVVFNQVVTGSGGLTQTGSGILVLPTSDSYTGTTTISGGTLQIGNGGIGASIGSTSGVTDNANLIFDGGDAVIFNPAISGNGSLTQIGSGIVTLTGVNSYSGTTTVYGGTLQIAAGGSLSRTSSEYVGFSGTGVLVQSGGTNGANNGTTALYLGYNSGSNGLYSLGGNGQLLTANQYVGYSGNGALVQSGGTNAINGYLLLGRNAGSSGTYNLSGSGQVSAYNYEYMGYNGAGTFTQTGGTNTIDEYGLYLGYNAGSSGTYNLSGSGQVSAYDYEYVGYNGAGTFTQTGGTNTIDVYGLYLGYNAGTSGTYSLSGNGQLLTGFGNYSQTSSGEYVGYSGNGGFSAVWRNQRRPRLSLARPQCRQQWDVQPERKQPALAVFLRVPGLRRQRRFHAVRRQQRHWQLARCRLQRWRQRHV